MGIIDYINRLETDNALLKKEKSAIRQGAHDWKKRAKAAEADREKLMVERAEMQREHSEDLVKMAKMLTENEMKLAKAQVDLRDANDDKEDLNWTVVEMEEEILRLKAEVYDLTHSKKGECKCKRGS